MSHTPYFWMSLVGATLLATSFGVGLPYLFFLVWRRVHGMRPRWKFLLALGAQSILFGVAWAFDVYCQWFGLVRYQEVMLFLWGLAALAMTIVAYLNYEKLNRFVARRRLEAQTRLLRVVQELAPTGILLSSPDPAAPSGWRIREANKAACIALGYWYRTMTQNGLVGVDGFAIVPERHRSKASKYRDVASAVRYHLQLQTQQGTLIYADVAGQTLRGYHGQDVRVTVFSDETTFMEQYKTQRDEHLAGQLVEQIATKLERLDTPTA